MSLRIALAAALLAAFPAAAGSRCFDGDHRSTSVQCGDGQVWDASSQSCVDANA